MADDLVALPKVELHVHLDCSAGYRTLREAIPGLTEIRFRDRFVPPSNLTDLPDFLQRADALVGHLQTERVLRVLVDDVIDQLLADGVVYVELRFAPHQHTRQGLSSSQVVEVVESQLRVASARTGVEARLILCTLMHFPSDISEEVARLAADFRGTLVTGFDVAGDAVNFSFEPHRRAFALARASGVAITVHAGEVDGPESIVLALDELGASRIGHGIRAVADPALVRRLAREHIHLEVCPRCNVQVRSARSIAGHPVNRLRASGVRVGISSDSRTLTGSIVDEYRSLREEAHWPMAWMQQANLDAIEAAFVGDDVKSRITDYIRHWSLGST